MLAKSLYQYPLFWVILAVTILTILAISGYFVPTFAGECVPIGCTG